jgi:methyl-accepting chemotaxis protein
MSLKAKVILLITFISLLMGSALFGLTYKSIDSRFNESQAEWVQTVASALSTGILQDINHKTPEKTRKQLLVAVQNDLAFDYAVVVDSDVVFADSFTNKVPDNVISRLRSSDKIEPLITEFNLPSGTLHHYAIPLDGQGRMLHIGANQKEINALMHATAIDIAMALLPVTLLAIWLAILITRNLNRELSELSEMIVHYRATGVFPEYVTGSGNSEVEQVVRKVETLTAQHNTIAENNHQVRQTVS